MEKKKQYDFVLFDFDGTIADTSEGIFRTFDYVKTVMGGRDVPKSEYQKLIGPPLTYSFSEFFGMEGDKVSEAVKTFREYYETHGLFQCSLYSGLPSLFATLKNGGKTLLVATSKPELYAKKLLAHFGVSEYFSFVGGSDKEEKRAKKSEVIEYVLSVSKIEDKSRAVMVGDRLYDAEGARQAGLDCIGVLYGFGSLEELKSAGVVDIAETPAHLARILL